MCYTGLTIRSHLIFGKSGQNAFEERSNLVYNNKKLATKMSGTACASSQWDEEGIGLLSVTKAFARSSGKTVAFLVPIVESLLHKYHGAGNTKSVSSSKESPIFALNALIVAPTRELIEQIYSVAQSYLSFVREEYGDVVACTQLRGGVPIPTQINNLKTLTSKKTSNIVVGTPGRLAYLFENLKDPEDWTLKTLDILTFDEADRLLDMGFKKQIDVIMSKLPKQRRTYLFSATLTTDLERMVKTGMRNAALIRVKPIDETAKQKDESNEAKPQESASNTVSHVLPETLDSFYLTISLTDKLMFTLKFLENVVAKQAKKCLIFMLTCQCVDFTYNALTEVIAIYKKQKDKYHSVQESSKYAIVKLHGRMSQKQRTKAYETFAKEKYSILLATDIVARGIDIPDLAWILQYDLPQDPDNFVHRIGRTARAGKTGNALTLLDARELAYVPFLKNRKVCMDDFRQSQHAIAIKDTLSVNSENGDTENVQLIHNECDNCPVSIIKRIVRQDRELYLKATQAFVSYIRAYKENQLSFICSVKNLDIGGLATSLALPRIPRVKEILGKKIENFEADSIDPLDIPFKNAKLEVKRQKQLGEIKQQRELRKQDKIKLRNKLERAQEKPARTKSEKRHAKRRRAMSEWDELALEERLTKKLRQHKITTEQYEMQLSAHNIGDEVSDVSDDE